MNHDYHSTPAQRLAAVAGKCFPTQSKQTRDALRHAAYSKFIGREVKSSADLTDAEIQKMLEAWEHYKSPFFPSERAVKECNEFALEYQHEHGQTEMPL